MRYRNLGRTGIRVSELCLGTMMFGRSTDEQSSVAMIDRALDEGINFIDTADVYGLGESERIVGKALSGNRKRNDIVLATKAFFPLNKEEINGKSLSRRHLLKACDDSLRRLKTDWIDLYQLHRSQHDIPIDESLRALEDLIRQGKLRYIGCSMFPAWKMVEALWASKELGFNRFVSEQPAYHLLDRTAEREVIPAARSFGLAVIPWAPLCGGLLSGKYRRNDVTAAGRWQGGQDNHGRKITDKAFEIIDALANLAAEKSCSVSQLALAWNAAQPGITAPIIGPRLMEQLVDNIGAVGVRLTQEDMDRIDLAAPPLSTSLKYYEAALQLDLRPNCYGW